MANDTSGSSPDPDASVVVRELLGEVPSPTIPSEVSERVLAAIEAESQKRSADSSANVYALQRSSKFRRLLPVAASAAAIGLLWFLVWPQAVDGDAPETFAAGTGCTVSAASAADMSPVLHASGTTYTKVSLASQAESMARQPAVLCDQAALDDSGSLAFGAKNSGSETGSTQEVPAAEGDPEAGTAAIPEDSEGSAEVQQSRPFPTPGDSNGRAEAEASVPQALRREPVVRQCVVSFVEGRVVHAIDVARFDAQPVVVVVVASPREVFVLECGRGKPKVLAQQALRQRALPQHP